MEQAAALAQGMQRQSSLDSLRAHLTSIEGEGKDVRAGAGPGGEGGRTRSMDLEQQVKVLQGELDELDERWEEQEARVQLLQSEVDDLEFALATAGGARLPPRRASAEPPPDATDAPAAASSAVDLPQGWESATDDFGRTYYFHEGDDQVTWEKPKVKGSPPQSGALEAANAQARASEAAELLLQARSPLPDHRLPLISSSASPEHFPLPRCRLRWRKCRPPWKSSSRWLIVSPDPSWSPFTDLT